MLQRNISPFTGTALAISMVVGTGIFALPGLAIEATDSLTALLGWICVIALMPAMIHIFSFLGRRFPSAGGITLYASHALGKWSKGGFLLVACGALAVGMPAFFMVGGAYIAELINLEPATWQIPLACLLAIVSTAMNIAGVNRFTWINKFVVISVLGLIVVIAFLTIPSYETGLQQFGQHVARYKGNIGDVWLAIAIVFWAFLGWENLSFGLEEFENPNLSIPVVFWSSFVFVSVAYLVFALTTTLAAMDGQNISGLSGLAVLMGDGVQRQAILVLTVMILVANANSWVFGGSRAFYSAARQGVMFKGLARLNQHKLPLISLLITMGLYILIMLFMWVLKIHPKYAFLLTAQGFIILYGASILTFYKLTKGFLARCVVALGLVSWLFLMHGFGWLLIYPIILFLTGVVLTWKSKKISKQPSLDKVN